MAAQPGVDTIWRLLAEEKGEGQFSEAELDGLPEPAVRYFRHVLEPGAPLARSVQLKMHGALRLKQRWLPMRAQQVLAAGKGLVWSASLRMGIMPIRGYDYYFEGQARVHWKLLGLVAVADQSGPDVARSAAGRLAMESMLVPASLLPRFGVQWTQEGKDGAVAAVPGGHRLHFLFAADGAPLELWALRYGELDGSFREERFGARLEAELRFQGIRIPCRLSVGWYFGMDRYEREGEFFRAVIDEAIFR